MHHQGFLLLLNCHIHLKCPGLEALCSDLLRASGGLPPHQVPIKGTKSIYFLRLIFLSWVYRYSLKSRYYRGPDQGHLYPKQTYKLLVSAPKSASLLADHNIGKLSMSWEIRRKKHHVTSIYRESLMRITIVVTIVECLRNYISR